MKRSLLPRARQSPETAPLLVLVALCTLFWWHVLFTSDVLLSDYLGGFAPFGSNATAPWNLLRWDALAQYFPWRAFAAREIAAGHIPLWNPHQFAGTPFLANGQSAVFYPLSLPFWLFDTARAFGISAWLHSLLASLGAYALARHWKFGRVSALLAAVIFAFSGYLTTWVSLPTLSNTASWLPLLLLLFERARRDESTPRDRVFLACGLACALLAGHPQIFFYTGCALGLRALLCPRPGRALIVLARGCVLCIGLAAIQILPMLELARGGHRAAQGGASAAGWAFVKGNALPTSDYLSLFIPGVPLLSFSENFGYIGIVAALLAFGALATGAAGLLRRHAVSSEWVFAAVLCLFGLFYALATPLAAAFYFTVPGLAQMGGTGRAFVLWTLGAALLAAFALELLKAKLGSKGTIPLLAALAVVTMELLAATWQTQPTAPRASIYPATELTTYLQNQTREGGRILFMTPRSGWGASEEFAMVGSGRTHPAGVLPPNGATFYGLSDVNGYDSLALNDYRKFVGDGEGKDVSPLRNGNMILLENVESRALDSLDVRWVVSEKELASRSLTFDKSLNGCYVYRRNPGDTAKIDGHYFAPGWHDEMYQPQSFKFGAFLSVAALFICALACQLGPRKHE